MMMKKLLPFFLSAVLIFGFTSCSKGEEEDDTPYIPTYISASFDGVEINGIVWATRNVDMPGTFAEASHRFGMLYQWNRRTAWPIVFVNTGKREGWDDSLPERSEWYAENDPCPEGWRVPTEEELKSLIGAGHIWATYQGVNGTVFGTAPNRIFLPAAGWSDRGIGSHFAVGIAGFYWSSTLGDGVWYAVGSAYLFAGNDGVYYHWLWRNNAFSVRCVAK